MPDAPLSGNARTIRLTKTNPYIRAFAFAVMVVFAVYAVLPFYWLIIAATKTNGGIVGSLGLSLPSRPDPLTNLRHLFSYDGNIFLQWTFNSFLYTAAAGAAATALSLMAGYALYIYRFPGRKLLLGSLVAVSAIPGTTLAFPLYFLIAHLKLANNLLGVFLPLLVSPFGVFLMWLYLSSTDCLAVVQAAWWRPWPARRS
jgi:multiple sugar transport system permease protein